METFQRRSKRRLVRAALLAAFLLGVAAAHAPRFPEGPGPFEVEAPTISKAYYDWLQPGAEHVFVVPPLERAIPLQLLVLDDATGAALAHEVTVACPGGAEEVLETLDLALFEPFSQIEHRIRARGTLGPTDGVCEVTVTQVAGPPGPYTFVIGDEERFSVSDVVGLFGLGGRLEAWRNGPGADAPDAGAAESR